MSVISDFEKIFEKGNLERIYRNNIILSNARGVDGLSHQKYFKILANEIGLIERKVRAGSYSFSKYRLKLISKGRGKNPREISIPSIRDRITLRAICDFLAIRYYKTISFELPQDVVQSVKCDLESGKYDSFIKLDIQNFYPSIKHNELIKRIRRKIKNPIITSLIEKAIQSPTVFKPSTNDKSSNIGVPQGLSISNILSAIYLINIDKRFSSYKHIKYYRYVDDILILCNYSDIVGISKDIISRFRSIGLYVHDPAADSEKSCIGKIGTPFSYLGYHFSGNKITVRDASIQKFRDSILNIFTSYKHAKNKRISLLEWRINLRVTGCIFENKAKGWLFFFSEINDKDLLHQLDSFISKIAKRFIVTINFKRLVRSYFEIKHHKYESSYLPNFDNFTIVEKKKFLKDIFLKETPKWRDEEIEFEFRRRIDKQVRDLLTDIKDLS